MQILSLDYLYGPYQIRLIKNSIRFLQFRFFPQQNHLCVHNHHPISYDVVVILILDFPFVSMVIQNMHFYKKS